LRLLTVKARGKPGIDQLRHVRHLTKIETDARKCLARGGDHVERARRLQRADDVQAMRSGEIFPRMRHGVSGKKIRLPAADVMACIVANFIGPLRCGLNMPAAVGPGFQRAQSGR